MSDFKANMHQIQFRLGLGPRPRWRQSEAYSAPPDSELDLRWPTSRRRDENGWEWEKKKRGMEGKEGRRMEGSDGGEGKGRLSR